MGFRFWRRIKIAPGVSLNLSKSGVSVSFGRPGARFTVGPRGSRSTVGIPGTGLFYTSRPSGGKPRRKRRASAPAPPRRLVHRLKLGALKRLVTPAAEEALVDGCRELLLGNEEKALEHLAEAVSLADGAYLAGFLSLAHGRLEPAAAFLEAAAEKHRSLGTYFARYGVTARWMLPIANLSPGGGDGAGEVVAQVGPNLRGVLLGLVEVYQQLGRRDEAIRCLERLLRLEPGDVVAKLSLAELLWEARGAPEDSDPAPADAAVCRRIVRLSEGLDNDSPIHAALFLYKARALRGLGMPEAARQTLNAALRRRKGRPAELLRALRYERAQVLQAMGRSRQARKDLERIYAEDPDYEDVAARLARPAKPRSATPPPSRGGRRGSP